MTRALPLLLLVGACVRYAAAPVDMEATVLEAPRPPTGALPYGEAVEWAVLHNPDVLALRKRAAAVNVSVPPEPPGIEAGVDSDQDTELVLVLDVFSLLGTGRRGAEKALARARRNEAWMAHHERVREIAYEIAEAYEVERVLASLPMPEAAFDPAPYVRAGFAPASAESVMRATAEALRAEGRRREAERASNRLALLRLLGASPLAAVEIAPTEAPWPEPPPADWKGVLKARADLQRRLASYEVAEGEFRRAVAEQYPALVVSPSVGGDPVDFFGAVSITLPIGASKDARAAEAARDAARLELQGAVLDGLRDAEAARHDAAAAAAELAAARMRRAAQEEILRTAMAELEGRSGSFLDVVFSVEGLVDAATAEREAALGEVRARLAAARAAGSPVLP
ncbi:MAG TPA: hypothetical protein VFY93_14685 [Planctomycetota bacterium]|nr:hypothetical protein [Planctomycetota bacterium]